MDVFTHVAKQFLCTGKKNKPLCSSSCLDLIAQCVATDLGLKPAVLYDVNGASAEQVYHYLKALQEGGFVSLALRTVTLGGNIFIVNLNQIILHLERLLLTGSVVVIDVCPSRAEPAAFDIGWGGTEDMIKAVLSYFTKKSVNQDGKTMIEIGEDLVENWNLCTLFGVLLGYPATYWFDQNKSFENCLSLQPLVVTKVSLIWQTGHGSHQFCLFSFSIPEALWTQAEATYENWTENLQQQLERQTAFTELKISKTNITLPAVTL